MRNDTGDDPQTRPVNQTMQAEFVPSEEDELRLPPQLQGRLTQLIRRLQQEDRQSFNGETMSHEQNSETEQALQRLDDLVSSAQQEIDRLETKCASLESQAILVSVQQLDFLARGMALAFMGLVLAVYAAVAWTSTGWVFFVIHNNTSSFVLWRILVGILKLATRMALLYAPYHYDQQNHGSAYRRFQVFAIAAIIIGRVRLCRWQEQLFIPKEELQENQDKSSTSRTPVANHGDPKQTSSPANESKSTSTTAGAYGTGVTEEGLWEANYEISARFLYVSILRLRGLWTKTAQYLSSRADFMPISYVRELKRLQDEAPETDWADIDLPPHVANALIDIDPKPLASASIGQVHVARLKSTGEKVCLKVQHPHASTLIQDDLWSLGVILSIVSWMEPDYEFLEILMREWARESRKELDFRKEAQNLKDARTAMETFSTSYVTDENGNLVPFFVQVPKPMENLCTEHVLVMSFCPGHKIDDFRALEAARVSKHAVIDAVASGFSHLMYNSNIFNGDPHPGNLLVYPEPHQLTQNGKTHYGGNLSDSSPFTVTILDWGLAKRLPDNKRIAFCELAYAAATLDYGLLLDSYKHIGLQMKQENAANSMEQVRFFLRDMAPREKARRRIRAKIKHDQKVRAALPKDQRVPMKSKAYPGEFFFFVRVNELLHGLGSKFDVDLQCLSLIKPYAERGLRQQVSMEHKAITQELPMATHLSTRGFDSSLENKMKNLFLELQKEGKLVGAQFYAIDKNGNKLANVSAGNLGGIQSHIPMDSQALILGFSCTKAIAATIAHIMIQEGGYFPGGYDEPLCNRIWPEFCPSEKPPIELETAMQEQGYSSMDIRQKWHWKRQISLWHVLTHQAGMWNALPKNLTMKSFASCEYCFRAFEYDELKPEDTLLPLYGPGQKSEYHYLSFGWLVAGAVCKAYARKHGLESVTFEAVYKAKLLPRLSNETRQSGFQPCGMAVGGGSTNHILAKTCTEDISASQLLQRRRESLAMGETDDNNDEKDEENKSQVEMFERLKEFRGKEFLLDPRGWNSMDGLVSNVPAAGGRFTAAGLAHFYHDLGSGRLLPKAVVEDVTSLLINDMGLSALQGATSTVQKQSNNDSQTVTSDEQRTCLGCGYQLIRFDGDTEQPSAFGHAGVGGSIGFYHKPSQMAVGLMLNKADGGKDITIRIMKVFADHFGI